MIYALSSSPSELMPQILEEYITIPGALEFLMQGLEWIYQNGDSNDRECANGILAVVGREQGTYRW